MKSKTKKPSKGTRMNWQSLREVKVVRLSGDIKGVNVDHLVKLEGDKLVP